MITSWAEGEAMHKRVIYNSLSLKRNQNIINLLPHTINFLWGMVLRKERKDNLNDWFKLTLKHN